MVTNRRVLGRTLPYVGRFLIVAAFSTLLSCGGGGGNSGTTITSSEFQQGVFRDASEFFNRCATPPAGINTQTEQAYGSGSALDENNWLRSWSNDLYLWYDEIPDQNPAGIDPLDYFEQLKTTARTASDNPKDRFHFTVPTPEWVQSSQSGIVSGYGIELALIASQAPREIRIAFIEPNSPAAAAGLSRGVLITGVDGVDAVNTNTQEGVSALNAALFPAEAGETHTFEYQEFGSNVTQTVTLVSAEITTTPVQNVSTIQTATGTVGYLTFNDHTRPAEAQLINAVSQLQAANIDDLVLDVRYNGGGFLFIASQLAYMIAGETQTSNRVFESLTFNDKHPDTVPVSGRSLDPVPFYSEASDENNNVQLPTLNLSRVYVLTSEDTCSASESIINGLDGIGIQVIQIGGSTCGKPYGFYPTDNCATTYFTIQFRGENDAGFGDYADGFTPQSSTSLNEPRMPGCDVADDFSQPLGNIAEAQLSAALNFRASGACPAPPAISASTSITKAKATFAESELQNPKAAWRRNRIIGR